MAVEMGCRWALRHISIENFKSVTKAELTIAAQTFHLVTGPNGSGKSNLFEAIAFGLGQPVTASVFRVGTLEELAGSDHRDSRVCVDLVFERQSLAASMPSNHSKTDASVNNDTTTTKASSSSRRGIGVRPKACSSAGEGRLGVGSRYVAGNREYLINGAKVSRARFQEVLATELGLPAGDADPRTIRSSHSNSSSSSSGSGSTGWFVTQRAVQDIISARPDRLFLSVADAAGSGALRAARDAAAAQLEVEGEIDGDVIEVERYVGGGIGAEGEGCGHRRGCGPGATSVLQTVKRMIQSMEHQLGVEKELCAAARRYRQLTAEVRRIDAARAVLHAALPLGRSLTLLQKYRIALSGLARDQRALQEERERRARWEAARDDANRAAALRVRASILDQTEQEARSTLQGLIERRHALQADSGASLQRATALESRLEALRAAEIGLRREAGYLQAVELPMCLDGLAAVEQSLEAAAVQCGDGTDATSCSSSSSSGGGGGAKGHANKNDTEAESGLRRCEVQLMRCTAGLAAARDSRARQEEQLRLLQLQPPILTLPLQRHPYHHHHHLGSGGRDGGTMGWVEESSEGRGGAAGPWVCMAEQCMRVIRDHPMLLDISLPFRSDCNNSNNCSGRDSSSTGSPVIPSIAAMRSCLQDIESRAALLADQALLLRGALCKSASLSASASSSSVLGLPGLPDAVPLRSERAGGDYGMLGDLVYIHHGLIRGGDSSSIGRGNTRDASSQADSNGDGVISALPPDILRPLVQLLRPVFGIRICMSKPTAADVLRRHVEGGSSVRIWSLQDLRVPGTVEVLIHTQRGSTADSNSTSTSTSTGNASAGSHTRRKGIYHGDTSSRMLVYSHRVPLSSLSPGEMVAQVRHIAQRHGLEVYSPLEMLTWDEPMQSTSTQPGTSDSTTLIATKSGTASTVSSATPAPDVRLAVLKAVGNWLIAPDDATAAAVMALRLPFVHGVITYVGNRHTAGRLVMHSHSVRACGAKSDRRCVDAETQRFLTALEVRRSQLRELYAIEECMHAIDSQLLPYMHCLVEVAAKEEERSAATRNLQKVHEECVGLEAMHARLRALVSDKERLCDDLRQQQAVSRKAASVRPEPPHLQQSLVERRDELQAYLVSVEAKIASINQQLRQCVHVDIPNHQIELQQALDDAQALSNDARAVSAEVLEVERGLLLLLSDKAQVQSDLSQLTVAAEAEESYGEVRPGQAGDLARLQRRIDEARVELSELAASLADEYSVDVTEVLSHCDGPSSNHSQRTSLSAASLPEQTSMLLDALCEEQRRQLRVALQPLTHMTSAMPVTTITTSKATATTDTAAPRISPSSSSCSLGPAPLVLTESDLDASGLEACLAELDAEGHMRGLGITDCLRVFLSALQRRHQEGGYRRGGSDSSDRNTDRSGTLNATTNRTVTPCSGATQAKNLHRSSRRPGAASTPTVVNTHSSGNPDTSIIADAINGTVYFNERDARRLMDEWCDAHMRDEADADSDAEVEGTLGRGGGDCSSRFGSSSKMMELLEAQLAALRERHDQISASMAALRHDLVHADALIARLHEDAYMEVRGRCARYFASMVPHKAIDLVKVGQRPEEGLRFVVLAAGTGSAGSKNSSTTISSIYSAGHGIVHRSVSELSGGERSLLGLAFLFACATTRTTATANTTTISSSSSSSSSSTNCPSTSSSSVVGPSSPIQCPIYLLDEVDAALDAEHQRALSGIIASAFADRLVLCISHHHHTQCTPHSNQHVHQQGGSGAAPLRIEARMGGDRSKSSGAGDTSMEGTTFAYVHM